MEPQVESIQSSQSLTAEVELLRDTASKQIDEAQRSILGQFFTSAQIARFMASMLDIPAQHVRLLDAGAGAGSLLGAVVEQLCQRTNRPASIHITAYEIEPRVIPFLRRTLALCAEHCQKAEIQYSHTLIEQDFIETAVEYLGQPLFQQPAEMYTTVILNPPYRKIQTSSRHRRLLAQVGIETSNLYAGFVALGIKLLADHGEIVAITPRSFCNGPYFRPFRELLLRELSLKYIHVFESRQQAFRDNDVLQENIIYCGSKSRLQQPTVQISTSLGPDDHWPHVRHVPFAQVVAPDDQERFIHFVPDTAGEHYALQIRSLATTLNELGLTVSTGRVVDFRAAAFLRMEPQLDTVPLIYPAHLKNGAVIWPKIPFKKPNAIVRSPATEELLVPNECYVLVKRFSSKDEQKRVVATVYDPSMIKCSAVGFENHLNYFHHKGRGLDTRLASGLAAFLNSTLVDTFFRQFNGHTQVNATDLRCLRYPSHTQLCRLGEHVGTSKFTQSEIDRLVEQELYGSVITT